MNLLANGFVNFINGIFANWQMILFVILAVLLLMTIAFRKFKVTAIILGAVAIAIGAVLVIDLAVEASKWDLPKLVSFLVRWVPTVLFAATVILATLFGVCRGLRKSLILLAQEVGAAAVCIILYAVLVNLEAVDGFMLKFADMIFGGSVCNRLGVTAECSGLKDVLAEWLPTVIKGDFAIMLGGSKAYIYTLADLVYHVAFALILYVVFLIFDFILYIIYHCCYSERKYKQKITQKFTENKVDRRYSRHSVGGGVVGLTRGIVIGILSLSFLGTAFYIVAGRGEGKLKDYDFNNEQFNQYYSVYRSVESYGTYGIFKILNAVSSSEDVPYYLFAADLVFSGELDDEELGITENIVFRKELDAYTGFARDTMALLIKYGGDDISALINGTATDSAFNTVVDVMSDSQFRVEFNDLISEFDTQTYIINFAMSFVNTAVANIDDVSFGNGISEQNKDLLKLLFTKGNPFDAIPDEYATKQAGLTATLPYINVNRLVSKQDVQIIFNVVLDILTQKTSTPTELLRLVQDILPRIREVSLLSQNRAEELDPVLGRVYCYAANRFLTEEGSKGVTFTSIYREDIEWIGEINSLLNVAEASLELGDKIFSSEKPLDALIALFDRNGADYKKNIEAYDKISRSVYKSRIIGKTLSTSRVFRLIKDGLGSPFEGGIYLPDDIVYESTFNVNGQVESAGEMYNLLNGVGAIAKYSDLLSIIQNFNKDTDVKVLLNTVAEILSVKDETGKAIGDYITDSVLLRSLISATLINYADEYVYVPTMAREKVNGTAVKLVTKQELKTLFGYMPDLVEFINPVIDGSKEINQIVSEFIKEEVFDSMMRDSAIFQGALAKTLLKATEEIDSVVIPYKLRTDLDGWVSYNGKTGELKALLDAVDIVGMEISDILDGKFDVDAIKGNVLALSPAELDKGLNSQVLHTTLSKYLIDDEVAFGSLRFVVPLGARRKTEYGELLVKKEELQSILKIADGFNFSDETQVTDVLSQVVKSKAVIKDSYIVSASLIYALTSDGEIADMLKLSDVYTDNAKLEKLKTLDSSNPWKSEITRLIDALDEILEISSTPDFAFDEEGLKDKLSDILKNFNAASNVNANVTRLTVCYASEVIRNNLTLRLDETLNGKVNNNVILSAKNRGFYTEKELEALSDALNIFEIDVMNGEESGEDITVKVKNKILALNQPTEQFGGRSGLNVVYPSVIISGMMSEELDKILLDEGDSAEPDPENPDGEGEAVRQGALIEKSILLAIKGGKVRYSEEEFRNLINAVRAFGITDFDNLDNLDINDVTGKQDKIDEMCLSDIMRGVFTKQVCENNSLNVDHPSAYEEDIKLLKATEIKSIVELVDKVNEANGGEVADIEDLYFDDVAFVDIRDATFENGEEGLKVKSYLILSAISDRITHNKDLLVNRDLVDEYGCVRESEVYNLIETFLAVEGAEDAEGNRLSIGGWSGGTGAFRYPDESLQREKALQSEIARAKLTEQFIKESEKDTSYDNTVADSEISSFTDCFTRNTAYVLSVSELRALFDAIDVCRGQTDGTYAIPALSVEMLRASRPEDIDVLYKSSALRYKICNLLYRYDSSLRSEAVEEKAFSLRELSPKTELVIRDVNVIKNKLY